MKTILILFHSSNYFKNYYTQYIPHILGKEFPKRVSYFVELSQSVLIPLCAYLPTRRVSSQGIAFIDSTPILVYESIPLHRTFNGEAQRGRSSIGWFYGFKLHLVIDDRGELISFFITPGNVDDRKGLRKMMKYSKSRICKLQNQRQCIKELRASEGVIILRASAIAVYNCSISKIGIFLR